jgi:hypothetical protein
MSQEGRSFHRQHQASLYTHEAEPIRQLTKGGSVNASLGPHYPRTEESGDSVIADIGGQPLQRLGLGEISNALIRRLKVLKDFGIALFLIR